MKKLGLVLVLLLLAQAGVCLARGEGAAGVVSLSGIERIIDFQSDVTVNADGSMTVEETIKVEAAGREIKRGIYRDFPTLYRGPYLTSRRMPFEVVSVLRDGAREAFHIKGLENGVRVYIGQEDVYLAPGTYTYTLTYKTDRQLGFFKHHDELYWNATGNGWVFPIEHASARVILPGSIPSEMLKLEAYTGRQGSKGTNFTAALDEDGRPVFETKWPLMPEEGLTIVVAWPKGYIEEPTGAQKLTAFAWDNIGLVVGLAGAVLVFLYFFWAWTKVGIDPERGMIIPLFEPPKALSPAKARYLRRMGYDQKCLTATVVNLAVKRCLTIEEDEGKYTLRTVKGDLPDLLPEEDDVMSMMDGKITLEQAYHSRISKAIAAFKKTLEEQLGQDYFKRNTKYFVWGLVLSFAAFLATGLVSGGPKALGFVFMCVWLGGWTVGVTALLAQAVSLWRAVRRGVGGSLGGAIFFSLFALPFLGGEAVGLTMLVVTGGILILPVVAALVLLNLFFYYLIRAYTPEGRIVMDELDGFRMYLGAAEADRLSVMQVPEKTPALFEKYLPYAIALDVENEWAEQFSDVLARAQAGGEEYSPSWYAGTAWSAFGAAGFSSAMGGSLSSAISSSSAAPGSSSGFSGGGGGGGSSGGGGGGGGGGGW